MMARHQHHQQPQQIALVVNAANNGSTTQAATTAAATATATAVAAPATAAIAAGGSAAGLPIAAAMQTLTLDEVEKKHSALCQELNMDEVAARESWQQFASISAEHKLEVSVYGNFQGHRCTNPICMRFASYPYLFLSLYLSRLLPLAGRTNALAVVFAVHCVPIGARADRWPERCHRRGQLCVADAAAACVQNHVSRVFPQNGALDGAGGLAACVSRPHRAAEAESARVVAGVRQVPEDLQRSVRWPAGGRGAQAEEDCVSIRVFQLFFFNFCAFIYSISNEWDTCICYSNGYERLVKILVFFSYRGICLLGSIQQAIFIFDQHNLHFVELFFWTSRVSGKFQ